MLLLQILTYYFKLGSITYSIYNICRPCDNIPVYAHVLSSRYTVTLTIVLPYVVHLAMTVDMLYIMVILSNFHLLFSLAIITKVKNVTFR